MARERPARRRIRSSGANKERRSSEEDLPPARPRYRPSVTIRNSDQQSAYAGSLWRGNKPCSLTLSRACASRSRRRGPTSSLHERRIRRVIRSSAGVCTLPPDCGVSTRWRLIKAVLPEAAKTGSTQCRSQSTRGPGAASGNGSFGSISSAMTPDMSNIATSIRSRTAWSSACATGRIPRFIATWTRGRFRIDWGGDMDANVGIGEANFAHGIAAKGGLRPQAAQQVLIRVARLAPSLSLTWGHEP